MRVNGQHRVLTLPQPITASKTCESHPHACREMKWYLRDGPTIMEVRMEKDKKMDKNEMSGLESWNFVLYLEHERKKYSE